MKASETGAEKKAPSRNVKNVVSPKENSSHQQKKNEVVGLRNNKRQFTISRAPQSQSQDPKSSSLIKSVVFHEEQLKPGTKKHEITSPRGNIPRSDTYSLPDEEVFFESDVITTQPINHLHRRKSAYGWMFGMLSKYEEKTYNVGVIQPQKEMPLETKLDPPVRTSVMSVNSRGSFPRKRANVRNSIYVATAFKKKGHSNSEENNISPLSITPMLSINF